MYSGRAYYYPPPPNAVQYDDPRTQDVLLAAPGNGTDAGSFHHYQAAPILQTGYDLTASGGQQPAGYVPSAPVIPQHQIYRSPPEVQYQGPPPPSFYNPLNQATKQASSSNSSTIGLVNGTTRPRKGRTFFTFSQTTTTGFTSRLSTSNG